MAWKLLFINVLTAIRILGTIIFIPIYQNYGGLCVGIFSLICYLTDSIDGILARKWKVSTFFGALFDGVADKLFTIINFVVLYLITPYALIPIIFEMAIIIIQFLKFNHNLNVKSNIVGKSKVWVLAFCLVMTFLVSDINNISFLSLEFRKYILNVSDNILYFSLLLPALVMEILTLISYILEVFRPKTKNIINKQKISLEFTDIKEKSKWNKFKYVWLNPNFYEEHKNDTNLRDLKKLSS